MALRTPPAALLAASLLLAPSPAAADQHDAMHIGGFGGVHLFNDDNELGQDDVAEAAALEHTVAFGVRVAHRIAPGLTGEGELAFAPTRTRVEGADVVVFGWRAHGVYHPLALAGGRIEPFALFGAGGATAASSDTSVIRNDTDLVVHAGLGVRARVGGDWGARLDARLALPPSTASETVTAEAEFLVGVYRTFGRPPAAAPAAPPVGP